MTLSHTTLGQCCTCTEPIREAIASLYIWVRQYIHASVWIIRVIDELGRLHDVQAMYAAGANNPFGHVIILGRLNQETQVDDGIGHAASKVVQSIPSCICPVAHIYVNLQPLTFWISICATTPRDKRWGAVVAINCRLHQSRNGLHVLYILTYGDGLDHPRGHTSCISIALASSSCAEVPHHPNCRRQHFCRGCLHRCLCYCERGYNTAARVVGDAIGGRATSGVRQLRYNAQDARQHAPLAPPLTSP
mmetsp:Transcript_24352/g.44692  ORF Transcript_24352/g.44692 Transcript_24352/m.44692 type:complete len:248 (-) Transcript_24352:404-1147(-)